MYKDEKKMGLDVYLTLEIKGKKTRKQKNIYIRENGQTKRISKEEWNKLHPGVEPVYCTQEKNDNEVFQANITHNLATMARSSGLYEFLWQPESIMIDRARDLIAPLEMGLIFIEGNKKYLSQFNPMNKWGNYNTLLAFVKSYLSACKKYPNARVSVWR